MKSYDLLSPEGTRDLILGECAVVRSVEEKLHKIFKSAGFSEVITPGLEFFDVFNQKSRYFSQESMYKLSDSKGRLLVVRPDSTMPIARVVATRFREQPLPLRLYYSQNVFRNKPSMRGRSDEIRQTGIELIGSASVKADMEVISTAIEVLSSCEKENFRIEIGHVGFFKELASKLGADADTVEQIRSFIEVKNYPALNDLLDDFGDNSAAKALKQLPRLFGGIEVFDDAAALFSDEKTERVLDELKYIYTNLSAMGYEGKITVDLGLVNKMNYYTGIVLKGYLQGFGDAVISGGRYDKLLSEFGYDVPATGFAVNIDAVGRVLLRTNDYTPASAEVLVFGENGYETAAIRYCRELAEKGTIAEHSLSDSYDDAAAYARSKGIKKIVYVGKEIKTAEI